MIKLNLTLDELNVIMGALGEQPYKNVWRLVIKLQAEAQEQLSQREENQ